MPVRTKAFYFCSSLSGAVSRRSVCCRGVAERLGAVAGSLRATAFDVQVGYAVVSSVMSPAARRPYPVRRTPKTECIKLYRHSCVLLTPFNLMHSVRNTIKAGTGCEVSLLMMSWISRRYRWRRKKKQALTFTSHALSDTRSSSHRNAIAVFRTDRYSSRPTSMYSGDGMHLYRFWNRGEPLFSKKKQASITTRSALTAIQSWSQLRVAKRSGSFKTSSFVGTLIVAPLCHIFWLLLANVAFDDSKAFSEHAAETRV